MSEPSKIHPDASAAASKARPVKELPPAAARALAEAEERRRAKAQAEQKSRPKEISGREGPDPARYGDWENKGIASDF